MIIWHLHARISRHLLLWSALSIIGGTILLFAVPFWRGVGLQALVWGAVDAVIAFFGLLLLRRKKRRPNANEPETLEREAHNLRRLLLINAGLDALYIVGGIIVLSSFASSFARGNGVGIIIQGMFLLLFDAFYALWVQRKGVKVTA